MNQRIKQPQHQFSTIFHHVERLRCRAAEARLIGEDMCQPELRDLMLRIARDYERMANTAERLTRRLH